MSQPTKNSSPKHNQNNNAKENSLMKAMILEKFGGLPIVKNIPKPVPGPNQILIKVEAAPINPLDLSFIRGAAKEKARVPCQLGYEAAGVVVKSGGGDYADSLVGKRVCFVSPPGKPCAWAEYTVTTAWGCFPLEDSVSFEVGASGIINPVTAVAFLDIVKSEGHKAIVQTAAASQLGKMIIRLFKKEGIKTINVIRNEEQKKMLYDLGADVVLNSEDPDFEEKLKENSAELDAKICLECVCGDSTYKVIRALPKGSTIYIYGHLASDALTALDLADILGKNKIIKSFMFVRWLNAQGSKVLEVMQHIHELLRSDLKTDISKNVTLEEVNEAIKIYMQNMTKGKVLIRPHL